MAGLISICPTPIGNLGDVTQRTLDTLRAADVVCAEDTRVTGRLLTAFGIEKPLERLDENLMGKRAGSVVARALAGERIAYCSDAGMPGVSDPGLRLVRAARAEGCPVEVLPGASAASTAYVASGCMEARFLFAGFLPRKAGERSRLLAQLAPVPAALIFYESPHRLVGTLEALAQAFPLREAAVCRELTKLHEEVVRDSLPELAHTFAEREEHAPIKGEIAIVVDGPGAEEERAANEDAERSAESRARELAANGARTKDIARELSREFGLARNDAYEAAVQAVAAAREAASAEGGR